MNIDNIIKYLQNQGDLETAISLLRDEANNIDAYLLLKQELLKKGIILDTKELQKIELFQKKRG